MLLLSNPKNALWHENTTDSMAPSTVN